MKYQLIGESNIKASKVSLGVMRIHEKTHEEAVTIIQTALDSGINFFDHADIYGGNGKSEIVFARAMKEVNVPRESYYLQSKVGIRPGIDYNFEKNYIIESVDKILERLNTTYLDALLLHRPDMLWEPEEIAKAFKVLKESGKVRNFGVSNMNQFQVSYLQSKIDFPIIANQLQFSLMHAGMVSNGIFVNTDFQPASNDAIGILDYMREHNITIQAWSPFQVGRYEGVFLNEEKYPELNMKLAELAKKYKTSTIAISVAWILRHPAQIQVLIGTMTPSRIIECAKGADFELTREEWYELLNIAGSKIL